MDNHFDRHFHRTQPRALKEIPWETKIDPGTWIGAIGWAVVGILAFFGMMALTSI